ncbi:MAG TPA: TlpA disulfide reductase family protein [Opitutaceae bacterium]|nr:TlpA disulfide reductase family protein [Opitutaceae bacterium]
MKRSWRHIIGYTVAVGISFYAGMVTTESLRIRRLSEEFRRPLKYLGKLAPHLSSSTVDSKPWDLGREAGKVVVIEAWATWCGPCTSSIPRFQHLNDRFHGRSDFAFIGLSLDGDASIVKKFCADHAMTWAQLVEPKKVWDNSVAQAFEVQSVPFTCVIDKKGVVRSYDDKTLPEDGGGLEAIVQKLLSE